MSKNLNNKNDIITRNNWSETIKEIHIPANSSMTTKLGSLFSMPFSSKFIFNEINERIKIIAKSMSLLVKLMFSPKKNIIAHGIKLQTVPEQSLI